jgi:hypothetical protein
VSTPAEDVWNFVLPNGMTAANTMLQMQKLMVEMWRLQGLDVNNPLVVGLTTRVSETIEQSIHTASDGTVTVQRTDTAVVTPPLDGVPGGITLGLEQLALGNGALALV